MKIVNIEGEIFSFFWTTWGTSIEFSEKMWFMILLNWTPSLLRSKTYLSRRCKKELAVFIFLVVWLILVYICGPENCFLNFYLVKKTIMCNIIKMSLNKRVTQQSFQNWC